MKELKNEVPQYMTSMYYNLKNLDELDLLIHAAWCFSVVALKNEFTANERETLKAKQHIKKYLLSQANPKKQFKQFCACLIVENWFIKEQVHAPTDNLSDWLISDNQDGFLGALIHLKTLEEKLHKVRKDENSLKIFCKGFLSYVLEPNAEIYHSTRLRLLFLQEKPIQELFSTAIAYLNSQSHEA